MTTFDPHANLAYALVTVPPAPLLAGTALTVDDASLFPAAPFNAVAWPPDVCAFNSNAEIVRVTAIVGNVLTIDRAEEGTTAKAIDVGWQIANAITVKVIDDIQDAVNVTEADIAGILSTGVFDGDAAGGVLSGTYPSPGFAVDMATQAELDAAIASSSALAVIKLPTTSARNVIQPSGAAIIPLSVKGFAAQSADLLQFLDSSAVPLAAFTSDGELLLGAGIVPNGAILQTERAYTNPADLFVGNLLKSDFTNTTTAANHWYGTKIQSVLDGAGGSQAQSLYDMAGLNVSVQVASQNPDPLALNARYVYGLIALAESLSSQQGYISTIYGAYMSALHRGSGEAGGLVGFQGQAVLKGTPTVSPSGGFTVMAGQIGGVENTSNKEVEVAAGLESISPYIGASAGSRFTHLAGLQSRNQGDPKVKNAYGLRVYEQTGASVFSWAILTEGGMVEHRAGAATTVPLKIKAAAAQSANLLDLRNSADVLLTAFSEIGVLEFGSAGDTNLYRSAADTLKTDDTMVIGNGLDMSSKKITSVLDPTLAQDAATKAYVDASISGINWKQAVALASTAALPPNIYANGASGVGATLTGVSVGALTIDGTAPAVGARVLIKNEVAGANNGIYTVTAIGSGITVYVLTRATDFDTSAEVVAGDTVFATLGVANADTSWVLTTTGTIVIGTTVLTFSQYGTAVGPAGGVLSGTYPNPGFAVDMATQAELDAVALASVILLPTTDARNVIQPSAATVTPLTVKGFAAQSDNLLEFRDSTGALLADVTPAGALQFGATADVNLYRGGADQLKTDDDLAVGANQLLAASGYHEMTEIAAPATPAANKIRFFARDSGGGKTQLVAKFESGNTVVIAEDF